MSEKIKCNYPGCKKEQAYKQNFELINEEDASVDLGFCKYHFYIVMGGHFKAKSILEKGALVNFELTGPLLEVEIVEQVIAAKEMIYMKKEQEKNKIAKLESNNKK